MTTTTTALITKTYENGAVFTFREDGWFNMTKAAKHFGKVASHFLELPSTREYVRALSDALGKSEVYRAQGGWHLNADVGTWAHPKLAVFFARWLDVRFAVWCDSVIEDILKGNVQAATPSQEKAEKVLKGLGYTYLEGTGEWRAPAGQLQGPGKLPIRSPQKSTANF